ncbi:hypothetical protein K435DRAFT_869437 [Dendrothele bispora CBS 962.96]|uniref:Uncharacterized protein n=1 Tax=Dendrothele bispora (strain CBS 962.96) TaxID=1314807 RepID=A0A4S8L985_DENBC|nr:hypothetical protein K435DRAFT_869437 [Dendrothele bispora CBS 962.96]
MSGNVAPDTAALFAIAFEWGLYGISVWIFVGTSFWDQSKSQDGVYCLSFLFVQYIDKRENPGGPALYFSDVKEVLYFIQSLFYLAQTLLADAVVVYRCHTVWRPISRWVVFVPSTFWICLSVAAARAPLDILVAEGKVEQILLFLLSTGLVKPSITDFRSKFSGLSPLPEQRLVLLEHQHGVGFHWDASFLIRIANELIQHGGQAADTEMLKDTIEDGKILLDMKLKWAIAARGRYEARFLTAVMKWPNSERNLPCLSSKWGWHTVSTQPPAASSS